MTWKELSERTEDAAVRVDHLIEEHTAYDHAADMICTGVIVWAAIYFGVHIAMALLRWIEVAR